MNRLFVAAAAVTTIISVSAAHRSRAIEPAHTVWDSVYTSAQATRGDSLYKALGCVKCHGPALAGGDDGSPLVGTEFQGNWDGKTLQDLFDQIRNSMPPDNPKSVPRDQVVDIVGYLLSKNQFPAGGRTLPDSSERLTDIKVVFKKP